MRKFTTEISEDSFRSYAEAKLFGSADSAVVLWADVKRAAATRDRLAAAQAFSAG